jgi:hypothetical protein
MRITIATRPFTSGPSLITAGLAEISSYRTTPNA